MDDQGSESVHRNGQLSESPMLIKKEFNNIDDDLLKNCSDIKENSNIPTEGSTSTTEEEIDDKQNELATHVNNVINGQLNGDTLNEKHVEEEISRQKDVFIVEAKANCDENITETMSNEGFKSH